MIYLDANATEPARPESIAAVAEALALTGNPDSPHAAGRAARALLDRSRRSVAERLGAVAENCVFTSGGTEANVLAVRGLGRGRRLFIGATEHDAVRQAPEEGSAVTVIPVNGDGIPDCGFLEEALAGTEPGEALVCLMLANNETGVLSPVREIAALCRKAGALFHVDGVQAAGRMPVSLADLGADSLAVSAHKFGGPKGAGAVLFGGTAPVVVPPVQAGGGQERGRRGGTPGLPAIAGMAAALEAAVASPRDLSPLRDRLEAAAVRSGAVVCGAGAPRIGNTTSLMLPWMSSNAQVIALDLAGVCVSSGAACSSGKVALSHVLDAMGLGEAARNVIRVSLPWNVTDEAVSGFAAAYEAMAARKRPV